jgi:hypothetical protein
MSYCRFSSDDFQCDVYVWDDVSGKWRTEVAARRFIFNILPDPIQLPSPFTDDEFKTWWERNLLVRVMHGDETQGHWLDLPVPEGGDSYGHDTPAECADNLERLRALGFNVPQYAIDELREEVTS